MTDFTITEDFAKNVIEFDARFSKPKNCYDYGQFQKTSNLPAQSFGTYSLTAYQPGPYGRHLSCTCASN